MKIREVQQSYKILIFEILMAIVFKNSPKGPSIKSAMLNQI